MLYAFKQNILFLIFIALTADLLLLSAYTLGLISAKPPALSGFDIINCSDSGGKIHKCIRVDAAAGEINDANKGATYRVIYGQ